ncbi:MAG: hypothetical protein WD229_03435 [Pirellulales bacterium]
MRVLTTFGLAALFAGVTAASAGELKSGLQAGDSVGAFDVVKIAGAADDGVQVGKQLCYR